MKWIDALIEWNERNHRGKFCIPKKGTTDHAAIKRLMDSHKKGKRVNERVKSLNETAKRSSASFGGRRKTRRRSRK